VLPAQSLNLIAHMWIAGKAVQTGIKKMSSIIIPQAAMG